MAKIPLNIAVYMAVVSGKLVICPFANHWAKCGLLSLTVWVQRSVNSLFDWALFFIIKNCRTGGSGSWTVGSGTGGSSFPNLGFRIETPLAGSGLVGTGELLGWFGSGLNQTVVRANLNFCCWCSFTKPCMKWSDPTGFDHPQGWRIEIIGIW